MKHLVLILIAALTVMAAAFAGSAAAGTAKPVGPTAGNITSHQFSPGEAWSALTYWTPERMASAKPAPMTFDATQSTTSKSAITPVGEPTSFGGALGKLAAGTDAEPAAAGAVPRPYTNYPDRLNGKVFFTNNPPCGSLGCGNFSCSATIINSANKRKVWTAGHCVHGGAGDDFHVNWVFVPAYGSAFDGHRPYGTYTTSSLWTRVAWANTSTLRQDLGAAITNDIGPLHIVDRLGGQGAAFNLSRVQTYNDFGYPRQGNPQPVPPFDGFKQWLCVSGLISEDPAVGGVGPNPTRINCNMGGGASGGGWLISMGASGLGYINSVNSYIYPTIPNRIHGPYFGNEALSLYNSSG